MSDNDYAIEIEKLNAAIATGATEIKYDGGRSVRYDSLDAMIRRVRYLRGLSGDQASNARSISSGFATFSRGDQ